MVLNPSTGEPLEVRTSRHPAVAPLDLNAKWGERYFLGCDLGQSQDPSAVAVVRRLEEYPAKPIFQVVHLERLLLHTPYPGVVSHCINMISRPPLRGRCELTIDFTGVGRAIYEMFVGRGV